MAGPNGGGTGTSLLGAQQLLQTTLPPYLLGTVVHFRESIVSVPTSPKVTLVTPDPNRVFVEMCNVGGVTIYVTTIATGVATQGFVLNGAGTILILNVSNNGVMPQLAWYAFATVATSIAVFEQFYRPNV